MKTSSINQQTTFFPSSSQKVKTSEGCKVTSFVLNTLEALVILGLLTLGIMGACGYLPLCTTYLGFISFAISSVIIGGYQLCKRIPFPLKRSVSSDTTKGLGHASTKETSHMSSFAPHYSMQPVSQLQSISTSLCPITPAVLSIPSNRFKDLILDTFRAGKREIKNGEIKGLWYGSLDLYTREFSSLALEPFKNLFSTQEGFLNSSYFIQESPFEWKLREGQSASEAIKSVLKGFTHVDCSRTATIIYYYVILSTLLGHEKFDLLFGSATGPKPLIDPIIICKNTPDLMLASFFVKCEIKSKDPSQYLVDGHVVPLKKEDWSLEGKAIWKELGDWNCCHVFETTSIAEKEERKETLFDMIYIGLQFHKTLDKETNFYISVNFSEPRDEFEMEMTLYRLSLRKFPSDPNWVSFNAQNSDYKQLTRYIRLNFPFIEKLRQCSISELASIVQTQQASRILNRNY